MSDSMLDALDKIANKLAKILPPEEAPTDDVEKLFNHLETQIKNRSLVITGDESHVSIQDILQSYKDIDKPRDYDFQDEKEYELKFDRNFFHCFPYKGRVSALRHMYFIDDADKIINGEEFITFKGTSQYDGAICYDCMMPLFVTITGNHVHFSCEHECEKNVKFTVEINFPTGEVVYDDWIERFSEAKDAGLIMENDRDSLNYIKGCRMRTDEYCNQNILHHFVGNSCPPLSVSNDNDKFEIGSYGYDEESYEPIISENFKYIDNFCTDLWWVTMIDRKFYDEMIQHLPKERSQKYYEKGLNIVNIKPGKYRVTCYTVFDHEQKPYLTAEWISEADDIEPDFSLLKKDERIKSIDESIKDYYIFSDKTHYDNLKYYFLDYYLNCIGNGFDSKGDFYSSFKTKSPNDFSYDIEKHNEGLTKIKYDPYPNFQKQYSFIYTAGMDFLPDEWIHAIKWYYEESKKYFLSDDVIHYHRCSISEKNIKSMEEYVTKQYRKKYPDDQKYFAEVSKAYDCKFDGDFKEFAIKRWNKELKRILDFIDEALYDVKRELNRRYGLGALYDS